MTRRTVSSLALTVVVGAALAFFARPPVAVAAAPQIVVYVDDFVVEPKLRQDGGALADAFAAELAKDPSLDVLSSSLLRTFADHGAMQSMFGSAAGSEKPAVLKSRLDGVTVVITGSLRQGKHGLISTIKVSDRDPRFEEEIVQPAGERGRILVKGIAGGVDAVVKQYAAWAARAAKLVKGPKAKSFDESGPEAVGIEVEAKTGD